jgi:hypothetical protein
MKKALFLMISLLLTLAMIPSLTAPGHGSGDRTVAKILKVQNTVEVQKKGTGTWAPAKPGTLLGEGDILRTGKGSKALFVLPDGSQGAVNGNSKLSVGANFFKVFFGEVWMMVRPRQGFKVETPGATAGIQGTQLDVQVTESGEATLTVVDGEVLWSNAMGEVRVGEGQQSVALAQSAPGAIRRLSKDQLLSMVGWSDLGNPVVMVAVEEKNLGEVRMSSIAEGSLNRSLEECRYHLVDAAQMEKLKARDLAKALWDGPSLATAVAGTTGAGSASEAARILGSRLGADLLLVGRVESQFGTKLEEDLSSCAAYGQFRLIVAQTGQLLFTRDFEARAIDLSPQTAGLTAIRKVAEQMARTLPWDIPLYYGFKLDGEASAKTVQVVVTRCDYSARNKVISVLEKIEGVKSVSPRQFEDPVAIIDVLGTASAEEIAGHLASTAVIKLKIKEVTLGKVAVEVAP